MSYIPGATSGSGEVDVHSVKEFGAVGNGTTNDSTAIQAAIDYCAANSGTVYVPKGTYRADGLLLRTGVRIVGDGQDQSIIQAVAGSTNDFVFGIDHGITQFSALRDLSLWASTNTAQHGLHVQARRTGGDTASGLWHFEIANVRIYNFYGAGIWFEGGGTSSLDPIQFFHCLGLVVERRNDSANSCGVLMSGQVNQGLWTDCRIDGFGATAQQAAGVDVKMCRQLSSYDVTFSGATTYASSKAPHTHVFQQCTFQQAQRAFYIDNSASVTIDTCHFEGLSSGVQASTSSVVRVDRCHFASAGMGSTNPFCMRAEASAQITGYGNWFSGINNGFVQDSDGGAAICDLINNAFSGLVPSTNNSTRQLSALAATIDTGRAKTVLVPGGATTVTTITSVIAPNEFLTLRALTSSFKIGSGGNISMTGLPDPLTIPVGTEVTLRRLDKGFVGFTVVNSAFYNKTVRVGYPSPGATPVINVDLYEQVVISPQGTAITSMTTGLAGTPTDGQKLLFRITDNGTARAISWGASYEPGSVALPTTTVANKTLTVGLIYDAADSKWVCEAAGSRL